MTVALGFIIRDDSFNVNKNRPGGVALPGATESMDVPLFGRPLTGDIGNSVRSMGKTIGLVAWHFESAGHAMSWKVDTTVYVRREFVELWGVEGANVSELCRRFGESRNAGYKWLSHHQVIGCEVAAELPYIGVADA